MNIILGISRCFSFLLFIALLLIFACSTLHNEINEKDWLEVKRSIEGNANFLPMKKNFIIDEIERTFKNDARFNELKNFTFHELIDRYSHQYDSLNTLYKAINRTNAILDEVDELKKAESVSLDSDRGFIIFTLEFDKIFEDSIDYMILTYQYIDDYDQLYFSENSKLSHQAAGKFEGRLQSIMTDIFNGQNEIIYLKTDLSAAEVLEKNYGVTELSSKSEKEYLNEGLKVMVSAVRFQKGGIIKRRNGKWKYLQE